MDKVVIDKYTDRKEERKIKDEKEERRKLKKRDVEMIYLYIIRIYKLMEFGLFILPNISLPNMDFCEIRVEEELATVEEEEE